jgi:hypothetical protein
MSDGSDLRVIFFDAGGTLIEPREGRTCAQRRGWRMLYHSGTHIAQYLNMALSVSWGDAALNICPVSENKGVTSPAIAQVGETPIEPLIL